MRKSILAILCVAALAVCACGNQGGKKAKGDDGKVLYWKVPPAIMVELLDAKCELEQYKKDKQINERLLK